METRQPPLTACLRAHLLAPNFEMSVVSLKGAGFDGTRFLFLYISLTLTMFSCASLIRTDMV